MGLRHLMHSGSCLFTLQPFYETDVISKILRTTVDINVLKNEDQNREYGKHIYCISALKQNQFKTVTNIHKFVLLKRAWIRSYFLLWPGLHCGTINQYFKAIDIYFSLGFFVFFCNQSKRWLDVCARANQGRIGNSG